MRKLLKKIKESKKIVCIYTNALDTQKFDLGYIIGVNSKQVLMLSIDNEGNCDGYITFDISKIYLIEIDNKYIANIKKKAMKYYFESIKSRDYVRELLLQAKKQNRCIEIELKNSGMVDVVGFVGKIKRGIVTVNCVDGEENDGKAYLKTKDISLIDIRGEIYASN